MWDRYGLAWGLTVAPDSPGIWPFGALPGGSSLSTVDRFMMALSSTWIKPYYPGGGYPTVAAGRALVVKEEVLVPLKSGPQWVVVIPPVVREPGKTPVQTVWRFDVNDALAPGKELTADDTKTYSLDATTLARLAGDAAQPQWLRLHALNWLSETSFDAARDLLVQSAGDEGAARTLRNSAILNLGLHQHKAALPLMLARLSSTEAVDRAVAVAALGEVNEASVAARLRPVLDDPDAAVVVRTIGALGKLKDGESVAPLLSRLADPKKEDQVDAIAEALAQIGTQQAWSGLVAAASDRKAPFQARRAVMRALGNAKHEPALSPLATIVGNDGEEDGIRMNAVDALGRLGGREALASIRAAVSTKKRAVAESALRSLAGSKDPASVAHVVEIAGTPGHPLREHAVDQIAAHKLPNTAATLRAVIRDPAAPTKTQLQAAAALGATGQALEPADTAALWTAYQREKDAYLGSRLADALVEQKFSDKGAIAALVAGLDPDRNKHWFANVRLLRHLTGESFGPESESAGDKKSRAADLARWRAWWSAQPR
jgi:HEAT repeat protein